jgi:hypothetical protein
MVNPTFCQAAVRSCAVGKEVGRGSIAAYVLWCWRADSEKCCHRKSNYVYVRRKVRGEAGVKAE